MLLEINTDLVTNIIVSVSCSPQPCRGGGGCAWCRTPGLPAGGAGMCRVEVDAGGNLLRTQNTTPVNI